MICSRPSHPLNDTAPGNGMHAVRGHVFRTVKRFEEEVADLAMPAEFSLETMDQFIDWNRAEPYKVEGVSVASGLDLLLVADADNPASAAPLLAASLAF